MALRFRDAFSGAVVTAPLEISMPLPVAAPPDPPAVPPLGLGQLRTRPGGLVEMRWRALRHPADDTYRFLLTNQFFGLGQVVPVGQYEVSVVAPGEDYASHEPIVIALPRLRTPGPLPARRADFLVDVPLWPTRRAPRMSGETVVLGRVVHAAGGPGAGRPAVGYRVVLFVLPGSPPPGAPHTRSDGAGDFVFLLPGLRRAPGTPPTVALGFAVSDPGGPTVLAVNIDNPANPAAVPAAPGGTITATLEVP